MAERVESFEVVVASGVTSTSPQLSTLSFLPGVARKLEVVVPPGPSGFMGFRILHSGQVVIPFQASRWIVADNEKLEWPLEGFPTGNKWAIEIYNEGLFDHTIRGRFLFDELPTTALIRFTPVPIE